MQIAVNGETKMTFQEGMELEKLYEADMDLVENGTEEEDGQDAAQTEETDKTE